DAFHKRKIDRAGKYFTSNVTGDYELFPVSVQQPHPPLYLAAGTERSMSYAARHGFGMMLSTLPAIDTLAQQIRYYRDHLDECPEPWNRNPAFGEVDVARWLYAAETDEQA